MWRKHCFGAKRNYLWCFKIPIVLFNSESLDHNWKIFLYIKGIHDEKRPQFTDFVTLVNEKTYIGNIYWDYDKQNTFFY